MPIPNQVKIAILITYGINNPNESQLDEKTDLSDFGFNDMQFIKLTERFNLIIQKYNRINLVSVNDIQSCTTVEDCINLIVTKTK